MRWRREEDWPAASISLCIYIYIYVYKRGAKMLDGML